MESNPTLAYLSLGTNLGDRNRFLQEARGLLEDTNTRIIAHSSVYETEPWGNDGQPAYLNQVVAVHTVLSPVNLLNHILSVEIKLGRVRTERWGSRTIDIDILYFGEDVIEQQFLQIPHPRLHLRNFTLYPLAELAPDYTHPVLKKTNRQLLAESTDPLKVSLLEKPS